MVRALLFVGCVVFASAPVLAQNTAGCRAGVVEDDVVSEITAAGEIGLRSERLLRLASIRLPDEGEPRSHALALLKGVIGQTVHVRAMGERDRWQRLPARLARDPASVAPATLDPATLAPTGLASPASNPTTNLPADLTGDFTARLVETGLAIVDPTDGVVFCQPELLALEQAARERGLGLWAGGRYNPINATEIARLRERLGTFALVEGRVRNVGERQQRTYLNFGGNWADDFTIIVPKKVWSLLAQRGINAASLKGSRIRARGLLDDWQGSSLTLATPDALERIVDTRPRH